MDRPVVGIALFILNEKNEILLGLRNGLVGNNTWGLPGGKLDKNESFENASLREVTEECGLHGLEITTPLLSTYHSYWIDDQNILKRTAWFEMLYSGDEVPVPQIDEDITEIKWVPVEDLRQVTGNTYLAVLDVLKYGNLL